VGLSLDCYPRVASFSKRRVWISEGAIRFAPQRHEGHDAFEMRIRNRSRGALCVIVVTRRLSLRTCQYYPKMRGSIARKNLVSGGLVLVAAEFGNLRRDASALAVPEPAGIVLIGIAAVGLLWRWSQGAERQRLAT